MGFSYIIRTMRKTIILVVILISLLTLVSCASTGKGSIEIEDLVVNGNNGFGVITNHSLSTYNALTLEAVWKASDGSVIYKSICSSSKVLPAAGSIAFSFSAPNNIDLSGSTVSIEIKEINRSTATGHAHPFTLSGSNMKISKQDVLEADVTGDYDGYFREINYCIWGYDEENNLVCVCSSSYSLTGYVGKTSHHITTYYNNFKGDRDKAVRFVLSFMGYGK